MSKHYVQFYGDSEIFDGIKTHSKLFSIIEEQVSTAIESGLIKLREWNFNNGMGNVFMIELSFCSPIMKSRKDLILSSIKNEYSNVQFSPETDLDEEDMMVMRDGESLIRHYRDDFKEKEEYQRIFI